MKCNTALPWRKLEDYLFPAEFFPFHIYVEEDGGGGDSDFKFEIALRNFYSNVGLFNAFTLRYA